MNYPDEVLKQAREICAKVYTDAGYEPYGKRFLDGSLDPSENVKIALAALTTSRQKRDALVGAATEYLKWDGSSGTYSATKLWDAREKLRTALKAAGGAPQ